jgi:hypothetical protein
MARQIIDIDTVQPNGKKGDPARTMAQKINTNFAALMGNTKANFAWFGPASGSDAAPGFRAMVAADLPSALRAAAQSGAQSLFWATPPTASGVPTLRGLAASDIPSLSGTYLTVNGDQVVPSKKVFGASTTAADRVEVSSAGVIGYGSGTGSVAYGFTFDSRLPSVAAQIFARFQVMDISGSATVARIVAANYQGNQGEYRFAHNGTATAVLWQSTSDGRIKQDFVQIEDPHCLWVEPVGCAGAPGRAAAPEGEHRQRRHRRVRHRLRHRPVHRQRAFQHGADQRVLRQDHHRVPAQPPHRPAGGQSVAGAHPPPDPERQQRDRR